MEEQTMVGTANEELNETAILPSHDGQGNFCGGVGHISRMLNRCQLFVPCKGKGRELFEDKV